MVERVRITPSQIILRDSSGNVKFDTNNYYFKTNAGGNFSVSGDRPAVTVYGKLQTGARRIAYRDTGWSNTGIYGGYPTLNQNIEYLYYIPKCNYARIWKSEHLVTWSQYNSVQTPRNYTQAIYSSSYRPFYTYDGRYPWYDQRYEGLMRWNFGAVYDYTAEDAYGNPTMKYRVWPELLINPISYSVVGREMRLPMTANEFANWTGTWTQLPDGYGNGGGTFTKTLAQTPWGAINPYTSTSFVNAVIANPASYGVMMWDLSYQTQTLPTTLSLAVTP